MMNESEICCECRVNPGKYRCPRCHKYYCCLNCAKLHKAKCSQNQEKNVENKNETEKTETSPFELFRSHKSIMDAISHPELQEIIKKIDSSENREQALIDEMKKNSYFKKFVDDLLNKMPQGIEP